MDEHGSLGVTGGTRGVADGCKIRRLGRNVLSRVLFTELFNFIESKESNLSVRCPVLKDLGCCIAFKGIHAIVWMEGEWMQGMEQSGRRERGWKLEQREGITMLATFVIDT